MFGYAFKPLGLSHLDLALPSQTIEYDLKMLRAFDRHLKPGGVVLISLSQIHVRERGHRAQRKLL